MVKRPCIYEEKSGSKVVSTGIILYNCDDTIALVEEG